MMARVSRPKDAALAKLMEGHPMVGLQDGASDGIEFVLGDWARRVDVARGGEDDGLVELADNNPMVCADGWKVPPPASTLALVALGPLVRAGLILEPPVVQTNAPITDFDGLESAGWKEGVDWNHEARDTGRVLAAQAMAVVPAVQDWDEVDGLYDEAYGRSFYVRRDEESEWHVSLVAQKPFALYRLRVAPDEPRSLVTVQVMADIDGKCGAAQLVHAFNVMCGFEECLGIPTSLA